MKQVLIEKYGIPWEVARCADVALVGGRARDLRAGAHAGRRGHVDQHLHGRARRDGSGGLVGPIPHLTA